MPTVSDIFVRLGGPARVGAIIGKTTEHASIMRRRGSIPIRYWPAVVAAEPVDGMPRTSHAELVSAHLPDEARADPDFREAV